MLEPTPAMRRAATTVQRAVTFSLFGGTVVGTGVLLLTLGQSMAKFQVCVLQVCVLRLRRPCFDRFAPPFWRRSISGCNRFTSSSSVMQRRRQRRLVVAAAQNDCLRCASLGPPSICLVAAAAASMYSTLHRRCSCLAHNRRAQQTSTAATRRSRHAPLLHGDVPPSVVERHASL
jgi:hypothetical protein